MSTGVFFWPKGAALDFFTLCSKWAPEGQGPNDEYALWSFQAALPEIAESFWLNANGWNNAANNIQRVLRTKLKPEMAGRLAEMYKYYCSAAQIASGLQADFMKIYAKEIELAQDRDAAVGNVPTGGVRV